jgi:hypothetical protein
MSLEQQRWPIDAVSPWPPELDDSLNSHFGHHSNSPVCAPRSCSLSPK